MEQQQNSTALATVELSALARLDELTVPEITARVAKIKEVQEAVMEPGVHYGVVPGTKGKPALMKPGAEILGMAFRLAAEFVVTKTFDGPHLNVDVECNITHAPSKMFLGQGHGSCSTRESKYAWRKGERVCPDCGKPAITKSKYGDNGRPPGWFCFAKKDGCGAKFDADDKRIVEQIVGRIPNPDVADTYNTVLKMAIKRAHVAAILFVCCASEIFTQDVEDMPRGGDGEDDGNFDGENWRDESNAQHKPAAKQNDKGQPRAQNNGKGGARPDADARARMGKLIQLYQEAISPEQLESLEVERQEIWGRLNGDDKRMLKATADGAKQRLRDWEGQATGTDGKL